MADKDKQVEFSPATPIPRVFDVQPLEEGKMEFSVLQ